MRNMLIRPSREELEHFHPDYVIYNAGAFPANRFTSGMTSSTSVALNFAEKEMIILGTEYAGEMKKGVSIRSASLSVLQLTPPRSSRCSFTKCQ